VVDCCGKLLLLRVRLLPLVCMIVFLLLAIMIFFVLILLLIKIVGSVTLLRS
jgi:hypothetical protein